MRGHDSLLYTRPESQSCLWNYFESVDRDSHLLEWLHCVSRRAPTDLRYDDMKKRPRRKRSRPSQLETSVITDAVNEVDRETQADGGLTQFSHGNHDFEHFDSGKRSRVLGPRRLC